MKRKCKQLWSMYVIFYLGDEKFTMRKKYIIYALESLGIVFLISL